MTYHVLTSYDGGGMASSRYVEYDKALVKFFSQFAANIANHNSALEMLIDEQGNVYKTEYYAKEIPAETAEPTT